WMDEVRFGRYGEMYGEGRRLSLNAFTIWVVEPSPITSGARTSAPLSGFDRAKRQAPAATSAACRGRAAVAGSSSTPNRLFGPISVICAVTSSPIREAGAIT